MADAVGLMPKEQAIEFILNSPVKKAPEINIALFIAATALHGQTTWDGEDYDPHYLRVGMTGTKSKDKMIIGILHDVVEDTDWELDDLRRVGFDERIVNGVDGVTKRPGELYFDFVERCSLNPDSIDIKISDLTDNMSVSRNDNFPNDKQLEKQRAYIVSYQYLVAVKKGRIAPGSSVRDFMLSQTQFKDHMDLYEQFSRPANGRVLSAAEIVDLQKQTGSEMATKWQPRNLILPRLPLLFGQVANKEPFDHPVTLQSKMTRCAQPANIFIKATEQDASFVAPEGLYIEDLPIKFPGSAYKIPQIIWDNFGDLLVQQMELEDGINPEIDSQYVYLTIQQGMVAPDRTQRPPGTHIDGFQKHSIIPQIAQHQISVTNARPTVFYAAAVNEETLALPKKEFFKALAQDCENQPTYTPPLYELHLLNAYCPHRPDAATEEQFRTFVRFSISSIPFMGQDNTHNPLFDYEWTDEKKAEFYRSITKPECL